MNEWESVLDSIEDMEHKLLKMLEDMVILRQMVCGISYKNNEEFKDEDDEDN
tara:strand:+ start:6371 stop:6526 length:156 start_codon:yes stop_codon:yes gene_type:complete